MQNNLQDLLPQKKKWECPTLELISKDHVLGGINPSAPEGPTTEGTES